MRTATCPDCGLEVRVRRDGLLYSHWVGGDVAGRIGCWGATYHADDLPALRARRTGNP